MRRQFTLALDNLGAVLNAAGMDLTNITRLSIYTTDVDEALKHFNLMGLRMGPAGAAPPMTLLGVTRLAIAPLMIEIEATAAACLRKRVETRWANRWSAANSTGIPVVRFHRKTVQIPPG